MAPLVLSGPGHHRTGALAPGVRPIATIGPRRDDQLHRRHCVTPCASRLPWRNRRRWRSPRRCLARGGSLKSSAEFTIVQRVLGGGLSIGDAGCPCPREVPDASSTRCCVTPFPIITFWPTVQSRPMRASAMTWLKCQMRVPSPISARSSTYALSWIETERVRPVEGPNDGHRLRRSSVGPPRARQAPGGLPVRPRRRGVGDAIQEMTALLLERLTSVTGTGSASALTDTPSS